MKWETIKNIMEAHNVPPETVIHAHLRYGEKDDKETENDC